jgi:hypothetical protein
MHSGPAIASDGRDADAAGVVTDGVEDEADRVSGLGNTTGGGCGGAVAGVAESGFGGATTENGGVLGIAVDGEVSALATTAGTADGATCVFDLNTAAADGAADVVRAVAGEIDRTWSSGAVSDGGTGTADAAGADDGLGTSTDDGAADAAGGAVYRNHHRHPSPGTATTEGVYKAFDSDTAHRGWGTVFCREKCRVGVRSK